ncbi:MAG: carboxypeptidase regulatory-like domain-containing protein [Acidobacteriales bacterium]|nr:carboxypeptidase regulatory-like domain-containing protein [Terriglobales bacterium]
MRRYLLFIALITVTSLWAQSPQGTITGTITDSQGARVPGVAVVATQVATSLTYKGSSSQDGTYVIPALPVGRYEVTAAAAGFKTFRRADIQLEVSQRLRLDITLELGQVSETITVQGEVTRVRTEESSLGTVVERRRIEELPMNGRHVFNLVKLVSGVQPVDRNADGFGEITNQGFSQIQFNGGPVYGTQMFLDGGANTVPVHNEIGVVPMVDAVEEFKVETNGLKAEFGQTSGGVVNIVTKAGTNEFHGSLYEFFRNDSLDARNAFATQVASNTGRIKPILRYNQYGGTVGGPVLIPKVYNGKNRTFFFAGYEQWRYRNSEIRRSTVPTALERAGDYSNTRDALGTLIPIYDPDTTRANPNGSGFVRDLLPGNVVPKSRQDALSLRVLPFMPLPNATPLNSYTNTNNFYSLAVQPSNQGVTNLRFDHRLNDKDSTFFRYSGTRNTRWGQGYGMGPADPDTFARYDQRDNHNFVLTETHVFSPSVINEFKANVTRQNLPFQSLGYGGNWPEKLGYPSIIPQDMFPAVTIGGMLQLGPTSFSFGLRAQNQVQFADSVTWIRGKHQIKIGFDQRIVRENWINKSNPSGQFSFGAGLTGDPQHPAGTGIGMATYMLGDVTGGSLTVRSHMSFHSWSHASYIQDDYKITPRLTLNLGLRYDLRSGPVERWNKHSNFDPWDINSETGMLGLLTYAGVNAPRNFADRNNTDFGPRFGFAYALTGDGKTVIRGAYGIVHMLTESNDMQADSSNSLGWEATTSFASTRGGNYPAFQFSDGPTMLVLPKGAAGGPSAFRGLNVRWQSYEHPSPYLQQANLTLQREILGQWVLTASYAGSRGVHIPGSNYNLNQLDPKYYLEYGLGLQNLVANPFYGQIASGGLSGATVSRAQLLLPYPDYGSVMTMANYGDSSTYHSLQLTAEKRYAKGISALISYTTGKLINEGYSSAGSSGEIGDFRIGRFNRRIDRAIDQNDISQRLVASGVFELPFGKGKAFASHAPKVVDYVIGGWQANTITTIQTGNPLSVRGANNFALNWPNLVKNPTLSGEDRGVARWFDTSAFQNPPDFVVGNGPRTLPDTRGPGMINMDLSAFKNFRIKEQSVLEFRAEAFNFLNHVNLNNPGASFSPNRQGVNTNASFGVITSSMKARSIQLGLRLTF